MNENEIWVDIPGHEGDYLVSNLGNVRSTERVRFRKLINRNVTYKAKPMKLHPDACGYLRVTLTKDGNRYLRLVHHLVFWSFNKNIKLKYGYQIDHIYQDKTDNRLDNLQYIKERYNYIKRSACSKKSSKYTGVHWDKEKCNWMATIRINGKTKYLGRYHNEEDAAIAYMNKLKELRK